VRYFLAQTMRKKILVLVALALSAALLPTTTASAAGSFTFFGSGFGHGLGMSQWGAYGMAKQGWQAKGILTHFYSHTRVKKAANPPATLRIGLTQGRSKIQLDAIGGTVTLRVENRHNGPLVGTIPRGDTWTVHVAGSAYRVLDANGHRVGGRTWGGPARNLYATYAGGGTKVRVPEGGATYNRGFLEFNLYGCGGSSCVERLILPLAPQAYLYGLGEVPSSWPMAAMRAQADAARSYAFVKAAAAQHRAPCNCALYDTSADQVYVGSLKEDGPDGARWVRAVNQTKNQVVTYQGATIEAFYTSSSGGYTENNENVWGGTAVAWLRGVCDPGDYASANPNRVWQSTFSASNVTSSLRPYTGDIGRVQRFRNFHRGVSGRIETVTAVGGQGSSSVTGTELRAALGLLDDRVWINSDKNVTGTIRTKYDNLMCAPGLPQTPQTQVPGGSRQRFKTGAIYHNTGASVTVWLKGPIYGEYTANGGATGVLGLPVSSLVPITGVTGCAGGDCKRTNFERGRIYWKNGIGAHGLWGPVLDTYLSHSGAQGSLGFPITRVHRTNNGGRTATFEHGTITCPSGGGTCSIS
jgi:SpoIID/LytB domain protein